MPNLQFGEQPDVKIIHILLKAERDVKHDSGCLIIAHHLIALIWSIFTANIVRLMGLSNTTCSVTVASAKNLLQRDNPTVPVNLSYLLPLMTLALQVHHEATKHILLELLRQEWGDSKALQHTQGLIVAVPLHDIEPDTSLRTEIKVDDNLGHCGYQSDSWIVADGTLGRCTA